MNQSHYAANGKTATACGKRRDNRTSNNIAPKCRKCLAVLAQAEKLNVEALVTISEDIETSAVAEASRAVQAAKALAAELGPGWKPRVFENLGWHYCVEFGETTVWPTHRWERSPTYHAQAVGYLKFHDGGTPRAALAKAVEHAREVAAEWKAFFDNAEAALAAGKK